jgi:hypothetical protein
MSLDKSTRLYYRRLAKIAVAQVEEKINAQDVYEFSIPGSQWFDPSFFPGFLDDPDELTSD